MFQDTSHDAPLPPDATAASTDLPALLPSGSSWLARFEALAPTIAAMIAAATVCGGLAFLCVQNLSGRTTAREVATDHANAVERLFFRR